MSELKKDGGPAFPTGFQPTHCEPEHGMSLRDYFAGQALAGFRNQPYEDYDETADAAYKYADALLTARTQPQEPSR